jgi:hypothetical protein
MEPVVILGIPLTGAVLYFVIRGIYMWWQSYTNSRD